MLGKIAGGLGKLGGLVGKLKHVAPILAAGVEFVPGGPVAKAAIKAVAEVVGGDPSDPSSVEAALDNANSADIVRLKQAEAKYASDLEKAKIDLAVARVEDVQDARRYGTRHGKAMPLMGFGILGSFVGCAVFVLWMVLSDGGSTIESTANSLIFAILGYLSAMAQQVSSYYFGSSQSGDTQSEHVSEIARTGRR